VPLPHGFAIPQEFTVRAAWKDGDVVIVKVEVKEDAAKATSVLVETANPRGVTNALMQRVPVRNVIGSGAHSLIHRMEFDAEGAGKAVPATDEESTEAVLRLVKWFDAEERFKVEELRQ
jgi:hypothetical protein